MKENKNKHIIQLLYENQNEFVRSAELAETLGVSTRTVKRCLKDLTLESDGNGYKIVSSNKGYFISIINKKIFNQAYDITMNKPIESMKNTDKSRALIIGLILVLNDHVTMDEVSEKLYLSKSTVSKEIIQVKKIFNQYNLELDNKPYYGYFINGREQDKRKFICNYLEEILLKNIEYFKDIKGMDLYIYKSIKAKVIEILVKNNIFKADKYIDFINKNIFTNLLRISDEKFIELDSKDIFTLDVNTINTSKEILNCLNKDIEIKTPMEEYIYISSLIGNSYVNNSLSLSGDQLLISNERILELIIMCTEKIKKIIKLDFTNDYHLINGLVAHIHSSIGRYSIESTLDNPILEMIKTKYIESYNCALLCQAVIKKELSLSLSDDDIGYIALHFAASSERKKDYLLKLCVVCENGIGFSQLIKSKLEEKLSNIEIVNTIPRYMIKAVNQSACDLLVTTVDIDNDDEIDTPSIKINYDLNDNDIANIKEILEYINVKKHFFNRIPTELFFRKAKFKTKEELLDHVLSIMLEKGYVSELEIIDLMKREDLSETVINSVVALPHCIKTGDSIGAIVTLEEPIRWGDKDVRIIILSCINPKVRIEKRLFPMINKKTKHENNINKLIESKSLDEFINVITN